MKSIRYLCLVTCALLAPACGHQPCSKLSVSHEMVTLQGSSPLPLVLWRSASPQPPSSSSPASPALPSVAMVTTHAINNTSDQQISPSSLRVAASTPSPQPLQHSSPSPPPSASPPPGPSGLCWSARGGGEVALTPDHRGNLWAVTTSSLGSHVAPGRVWVLNFTSLTWHHLEAPRTDARDAAAPPESSRAGVDPPLARAASTPPAAPAPPEDATPKGVPVASESAPLALCSWSKGIIVLYALNGSATTWMFSVKTGKWLETTHSKFPPAAAALEASWCGARHDAIWFLTSKRQKAAGPARSSSASVQGTSQTLWKLDHLGKWSRLEVTQAKGESHLESPATVLQSWTDARGNLFLLQEHEAPESKVSVVRFDPSSGEKTLTGLKGGARDGAWIPGSSGELYALFPRDGASWVATYDYYSGDVISTEKAAMPMASESLFVKVDGAIHTTIPACRHLPPMPPHLQEPSPPDMRFSHISLSRVCAPGEMDFPAGRPSQGVIQGPRKADVLSNVQAPPKNRYVSDTRAAAPAQSSSNHLDVEGTRDGAATTTLQDHGGEPGVSRTTGKSADIIMVRDDQEMRTWPVGPHQMNRSHTHDSIIFFSLSLSIFALVGIVVFVRRCVRCPPSRGLGDAPEDRGKPPSPLPVLYSIVPDDPAYETSATESPCISHHALYDSSPYADLPNPSTPNHAAPNYMTPGAMTPGAMTPGAMTPNAMTPSTMTPNAMTPHAMTPNAATPLPSSPNAGGRHPTIASPGEFPKDALTYAITHSASDAINIATNNAFNTYISTTQF